MRCEGWRRYGGAFTLGPVKWVQCENEGIVTLELKQDGKIEKLPACMKCWQEAINTKAIEIISVVPIEVENNEVCIWSRSENPRWYWKTACGDWFDDISREYCSCGCRIAYESEVTK